MPKRDLWLPAVPSTAPLKHRTKYAPNEVIGELRPKR